MTASSDGLFERAKAGDASAVDEISRIVRDFARHACRGGGPSGAPEIDWEDVAQESLRKILVSGLTAYRGTGSERSYLYTVVKTTVIESSRTARRRKAREESVRPDPVVAASNPGPRLMIEQLLGQLSDECRRLIELAFLAGEPYSRLAHMMGLAESSVRAKLSRCIRRARSLAPEDPR